MHSMMVSILNDLAELFDTDIRHITKAMKGEA